MDYLITYILFALVLPMILYNVVQAININEASDTSYWLNTGMLFVDVIWGICALADIFGDGRMGVEMITATVIMIVLEMSVISLRYGRPTLDFIVSLFKETEKRKNW
jgi:hypothetical protein